MTSRWQWKAALGPYGWRLSFEHNVSEAMTPENNSGSTIIYVQLSEE